MLTLKTLLLQLIIFSYNPPLLKKPFLIYNQLTGKEIAVRNIMFIGDCDIMFYFLLLLSNKNII